MDDGRNIGKTGFPHPFWQRSGLMAAAPGVRRSELGDALRACRNAFIGVGIMSCVINLLYLTGSIFMLEIYDRVLPSRSVPTLVGLGDPRRRIVRRPGYSRSASAAESWGVSAPRSTKRSTRRVFDTMVRLPLMVGARNEGLQPLRDLDNVRSFLSGMGPGAFFDLPWLPFYLAICFAFHVMIGADRAGRRHHPGHASPSSPNSCRARRRARPWALRRAATIWPPPAGATPKCWSRWECPDD